MGNGDERRQRGNEALRAIHGARGAGYVAELAKFAPEFADMLVDFAYGDIAARPGLDRRSRQFAIIAALTALGTAPRELQIHIRSALDVGCTREEIVEVIMQMAVYAGFPAALSGLEAAKAAFALADGAAPVQRAETS